MAFDATREGILKHVKDVLAGKVEGQSQTGQTVTSDFYVAGLDGAKPQQLGPRDTAIARDRLYGAPTSPTFRTASTSTAPAPAPAPAAAPDPMSTSPLQQAPWYGPGSEGSQAPMQDDAKKRAALVGIGILAAFMLGGRR